MKTQYLLVTLLALVACNKPAQFDKMLFTTGGGFTGEIISYEVDSRGKVMMESSVTKERSLVQTLSKSELKELHELVILFADFYPQQNETGNLTRSIAFKSSERSYATSWAPQIPALSAADMVFNTFIKKINKP